MKSGPPISSLLFAAVVGLASSTVAQEVFHLQWQESNFTKVVQGHRPHIVGLSTNRPADLKKEPSGLQNPVYGEIGMGSPMVPVKRMVILDTAADGTQHLYVDGNGNGDFTDDPPASWGEKTVTTSDFGIVKKVKSEEGEAMVVVPVAGGPRNGMIGFYTTGQKPANPAFRKVLFYYADYGLVGDVKIGGRAIRAAMADAACSGYFHLSSDPMEAPTFWLDLPTGTAAKGRTTMATKPFEVDHKWWAITNLTPGGDFQITASAPPQPKKQMAAEEKSSGPDLTPGHKAPPFTAPLLGGKAVKFPDDYKGKIVLVDFWATWCGPCVAELPNVAKAYRQYHSQGLEVLGVSLDRDQWEERLEAFTRKKDMTWPQVYDGLYWNSAVAKLYGIQSIPHMILVDGDTGSIIADKTIRGEKLAPAIESALAAKFKH